MANSLVDIHIPNGFRAIKEAHVHFDGIAVVSGINGCGKSTLSKLLYFTFKNSQKYDRIVLSHFNERLEPFYDVLNQLQRHITFSVPAARRITTRIRLRSLYKSEAFLKMVKELCDDFLNQVAEAEETGEQVVSERLLRILQSAVEDESTTDLATLFEKFQSIVTDIVQEGVQTAINRPRNLLIDRISKDFQEPFPRNVSVSEYGDSFIGTDEGAVPLPHYIQHVAYIDTPMIVGCDLFDSPSYWEDLNDLLKEEPTDDFDKKINDTLQNEILHGEAMYDNDVFDEFQFRREDGQIFDLFKCATGIKSFSILQLLLRNGFLKKDTLLIIDEPEAHLHPQWIVEYARIVLLLHQRLGVKFFIASHSTDFVGAMKEIAQSVGIENLNFYLAEDAGEMQYIYRDLGKDVEPIFASFNKSYEKLDFYASQE